MPIQFRCSACNRLLSIATRKAGTSLACPNCKANTVVPGASAPSEPNTHEEEGEVESESNLRTILVTACVALVLVGGLALALTLALRKPAPIEEQAKVEAPSPPSPSPQPPGAKPQAAEKQQPQQPTRPQTPTQPQPQPEPQPNPQHPLVPPGMSPSQQPMTSNPPQPQGPALAPAPHAAKPPPLDQFGNPIGPNVGLGKDGEFKGKKILIWCAYENAGRVFFHQSNPLYKALEAKGFNVAARFGKFDAGWLKEIDQLWIISSGPFEIPGGLSPELLIAAIDLLPPAAVPSGFTVEEYKFVVGATLDVALSRRHTLDEKALKAIEDFVKAGKGLALLAEDDPFFSEADELARRLFGARVSGNYIGDKVATVKGRGLTPLELRKYGAQFEVDDHPLLTGVNILFEGITVSNVSKSDKLEVAMKASDGKALLAVSKVQGQRVVIDCGFTRYCHGPTARTSYITKSPGTVRLAQNIAAYLAGK